MTKDFKKIDMHVHSHFSGGPERLRGGTWPTPEEVREGFKLTDVDCALLMSCGAPEHMHDPITSRDAEMIHKQNSDIFPWWFCNLDPRMAWNRLDAVPNYSYYIDFFRERGARGAGELQASMYIDDPRMLGLLSHCEKKRFPVTVHFGKYGTRWGLADDVGMPRLERVLEEFPKLTLIGHATAFLSEISSDINEETKHKNNNTPIVPEGALVRLMRKYPNLICDISAASGLCAITRDPEYTYKFFTEFSEQIVFATDTSYSGPQNQTALSISAFVDEVYKSSMISAGVYENICRNNALRILGE